MTIVLILIIIFCFGLLGYKLSSFYINRKKFFSSLHQLLSSLELDVAFSQDKLKNLINKNIESISSNDLKNICRNYCEFLDRKEKIDKNFFDNVKILKKDEKELLYSIFSSLGRFDAYSQSREIKTYIIKINEYYANANDECKKYAGLFVKLGIIIGILVCLLII